MNIKYIGNDTKKSEKGEIHVKNSNYTGCGARIDDNPQDWVTTPEKIPCDKMDAKINNTLHFLFLWHNKKELTDI